MPYQRFKTSGLSLSDTVNSTAKNDSTASIYTPGGISAEGDLHCNNIRGGEILSDTFHNFDTSGTFVRATDTVGLLVSKIESGITFIISFRAVVGTTDVISGGVTFASLIPNNFTVESQANGLCIANCASGVGEKIIFLTVTASLDTGFEKYIKFDLAPNQTVTTGETYIGTATVVFRPQ